MGRYIGGWGGGSPTCQPTKQIFFSDGSKEGDATSYIDKRRLY